MSTARRNPRMEKTSSPVSPSNRKDETTIRNLQKQIISRLRLIFLIPLLVIILLSVVAWKLDSRVRALEAVERVATIERIYSNTRNITWAIDSYERSVKDRPSPEALVRLATLYYVRSKLEGPDDLKKAVDILDGAKKTNYWEVYSMLATIYTDKEEEWKKAIEEGEKAIELNLDDASTYNNLAWIYATSRDEKIQNLAKARKYAERAIGLTQKQEPDYLDTLAEVYSRMGNPNQASETMKNAIRRIKAIQENSEKLRKFDERQKQFQEAASTLPPSVGCRDFSSLAAVPNKELSSDPTAVHSVNRHEKEE
jgi:tetratricopeptide (TPR) repeat protein